MRHSGFGLWALVSFALLLSTGCGGTREPGESPQADTAPRTLDQMSEAARRDIFDAIIQCENDGLRAALAAFPPLRPGDPGYDVRRELEQEPQRFMHQHHVETECKAGIEIRERLSGQQIKFLRMHGMRQGWFTSHADEVPVRRVPLGPPVDAPRP